MLPADGFLAAHFTFSIRLTENPAAARGLAQALARPCFAPLSRIFVTVKSRDSAYARIGAEKLFEYLSDRANHHVGIDSGRGGDVVATASFPTGEHSRSWNVDKTRFTGSIVLPHDPALLEDRIDALKAIATALDATYGAISLEAAYIEAQAFTLAIRPYGSHVSASRQKERRAQELYPDQLTSMVPGPEWGQFLSARHLARLPVGDVERAGVFARVDELAGGRAYLQLTADPRDVRDAERFEEKVEAARAVLKPISMDLANVSFS